MATNDASGQHQRIGSAPTKRVLIVEDEIILALDIADMLEEVGYLVVGPCVRLADAKHVAATQHFDCALLDVNLGNGDTSASIAEMLRQREIPFVFVTASRRDEIDSIQEKDIIIQKPIARQELVHALAKF